MTSPIVNKRILLETMTALAKARQPSADQIDDATAAFNAVLNDLLDEPVQVKIVPTSNGPKKEPA